MRTQVVKEFGIDPATKIQERFIDLARWRRGVPGFGLLLARNSERTVRRRYRVCGPPGNLARNRISPRREPREQACDGHSTRFPNVSAVLALDLHTQESDAPKAEACFERDQGRPQQARELLAPVYGWFSEGFDTLESEGGEGVAR
jgi:hypothetical protein